MSDNNLVNIKGMSDEQIMQAIGQDDGSNMGTNIPRLEPSSCPIACIICSSDIPFIFTKLLSDICPPFSCCLIPHF